MSRFTSLRTAVTQGRRIGGMSHRAACGWSRPRRLRPCAVLWPCTFCSDRSEDTHSRPQLIVFTLHLRRTFFFRGTTQLQYIEDYEPVAYLATLAIPTPRNFTSQYYPRKLLIPRTKTSHITWRFTVTHLADYPRPAKYPCDCGKKITSSLASVLKTFTASIATGSDMSQ